MQLQNINISAAQGFAVAHDLVTDSGTMEKGHILTAEDIVFLRALGLSSISVAVREADDLTSGNALTILCAKICGADTAYAVSGTVAKIVAQKSGLFEVLTDRVAKFNRMNNAVVLNVIKPYSLVKAGEMLAKLEVKPAFMPEKEVNQMLINLSGNKSLLTVEEVAAKNAALIYTHLYNSANEAEHIAQSTRKLIKNLAEFSLNFDSEYDCAFEKEALAANLEKALYNNADVVFVVSAEPTTDRRDVVFAAISAVADNIVCKSVPEAEASDFLVAEKRGCKIIALPYLYNIMNSAELDKYIEKTIIEEKLNSADFSGYRAPFMDGGQRLSANEAKTIIGAGAGLSGGGNGNVAAVVLAAGSSVRAGTNKLLLESKTGEPLFLNAVKAALKSKASPVFVITGFDADLLEPYLENIDVTVLRNESFEVGVRSSIMLGLKSVPSACSGAILLPADMPNITEKELDKLIKVFDATQDKQVCVLSNKGVKYNPILWSKSLFCVAELVAENANIRPVLLEHSDYLNAVEIRNADILFDVTSPNDVEKFKKDNGTLEK